MSGELPRPPTTVPLATFLDDRVEEFAKFMLGGLLAHGSYRCVYELNSDPRNFVVKIEHNREARHFCNITEWNVWSDFEEHHKAGAAWLAPCRAISQNGNFLVQARTVPLRGPDELPALVPAFLEDTHWGNFGWFEGRIVCHDYGFNGLNVPTGKPRMRPPRG